MTNQEESLLEIARELKSTAQKKSFRITVGELASLRRNGESLAFYKLVYKHLSVESVHRNEDALRAFVQACAIGAGLYSETTTGRALAIAGYSEGRLAKLLTSSSPAGESIRAARYLAAKGVGHNGLGFAGLLGLLSTDLEQTKRNLASTYYREQSKKEKENA